MGTQVNETIEVTGKRVPVVIEFVGKDIDEGKGICRVNTAIKTSNGALLSYGKKSYSASIEKLIKDTYCDGAINGLTVVAAIAEMTDKLFAGAYATKIVKKEL